MTTKIENNNEVDQTKVIDDLWSSIKVQHNSSGSKKYYYFKDEMYDLRTWPVELRNKFEHSTPQMRTILVYMSRFVRGSNNAKLGREIIDEMKNTNYIKTRIQSDVLFAYYARQMRELGLITYK
jgi:hypothetical protein